MDNVYLENQGEAPYKSYIKRSLGKIQVWVYDPVTNQKINVLLKGNPAKEEDGCIIDTFSAKEDTLFRRYNDRFLRSGELIEYVRKQRELTNEEKLNMLTDEELVALLDGKHFKVLNAVNKMTSAPTLYRMLQLARDNNKSERMTKIIEGRIAILQEDELVDAEDSGVLD